MIWRDIQGYKNYYQVSDAGDVKSLARIVEGPVGPARIKEKILKAGSTQKGYKVVNLYQAGKRTTDYVHHLVLEAFIGPAPNGYEGCHEDGDPSNNRLDNLRWDTITNNRLDKRRHGTHGGKPIRRSDGIEFINAGVAAEETKCNRRHISSVCCGHRKTTGGFGWKFI